MPGPYYLPSHHYVTPKPWYTTRYKPIELIVLHTAENLPDYVAPDNGAEGVAAYGASTSRASWHVTVDSDSTIYMLPDEFTAWHVRGYNSRSLGIEMSGHAATNWTEAPVTWRTALLQRAAAVVADWCRTWDIPVVQLTSPPADGARGIVAHSTLDPTRRRDPGFNFPWELFLHMVTELVEENDMFFLFTDPDTPARARRVDYWKRVLNELGFWPEEFGPDVSNELGFAINAAVYGGASQTRGIAGREAFVLHKKLAAAQGQAPAPGGLTEEQVKAIINDSQVTISA